MCGRYPALRGLEALRDLEPPRQRALRPFGQAARGRCGPGRRDSGLLRGGCAGGDGLLSLRAGDGEAGGVRIFVPIWLQRQGEGLGRRVGRPGTL